jgi:hypothetical protein
MMKFTRPITRELELGAERVAVTMGEQGVSFRPVGSRKPPHEISWPAILCHATGLCSPGEVNPSPESLAKAVHALKSAPASPTTSAAEPAPAHAPGPAHEAVTQPVEEPPAILP